MNQISLFSQPSFEQVVPSGSPINNLPFSEENYRLLMHLLEGKSIHCFSPMMLHLRIGTLHSRISDLRNKYGFNIIPKPHKAKNFYGQERSCKLYMMPYSEIERVKKEFKIETK